MISQLAAEKDRRVNYGGDHARHMPAPGSASNEIPARGDENRAHEIERSIYDRQISDIHIESTVAAASSLSSEGSRGIRGISRSLKSQRPRVAGE